MKIKSSKSSNQIHTVPEYTHFIKSTLMNESSDAIKTQEVFVSLQISTESQISDTPK